MEIREHGTSSKYDSTEIKCPYCFKTFRHYEVGFRVEPATFEEIESYRHGMLNDPEKAEEYKKLLKNATENYMRKRDDVWHDYWLRMGWTDNAPLFENGDGYDEYDDHSRPSALSDQQDPVIGIGKNMLIGKKGVDADGFVVSAVDNRGQTTTRRICPHCHNKLPKDYGKNPIKFIAVVGISGSGKTVMLSQLIDNIEDYATYVGGNVTFDANDSAKKFPLQYKVKMNQALPSGTREHFAPPIYLQFSTSENKKITKTTLVIYDIAGESCITADGLDRYGPFVRNSDGIILLLDPRQISKFSVADENAERPTAVLGAMENCFVLDGSDKCDIPLAVAYSKSDKLRSEEDIREQSHMFRRIEYRRSHKGFMIGEFNNINYEVSSLLKNNSNVFYSHVHDFFETYGFFAFSSLGHDAESVDPDGDGVSEAVMTKNLEPNRLEEPLFWLLYKWGVIYGVQRNNKGDWELVKDGVKKHTSNGGGLFGKLFGGK